MPNSPHPNRRRIPLYLWAPHKRRVQQAAAKVGETVQGFIEGAALARCDEVLGPEEGRQGDSIPGPARRP